LWGSVAVTFVALLVFGGLKGRFTGASIVRSALETVAIGGIAAAVAFVLARLVAGGPIT
jgi:VIT1/CCC1 family predicted Fe2+/Mn2+ transporter